MHKWMSVYRSCSLVGGNGHIEHLFFLFIILFYNTSPAVYLLIFPCHSVCVHCGEKVSTNNIMQMMRDGAQRMCEDMGMNV